MVTFSGGAGSSISCLLRIYIRSLQIIKPESPELVLLYFVPLWHSAHVRGGKLICKLPFDASKECKWQNVCRHNSHSSFANVSQAHPLKFKYASVNSVGGQHNQDSGYTDYDADDDDHDCRYS